MTAQSAVCHLLSRPHPSFHPDCLPHPMLEMIPASPVFQRIFSNPFPYVAFKATEPYLIDYVTLDLHQAIRDQGFLAPQQLENSPRHRTVVAVKAAAEQ